MEEEFEFQVAYKVTKTSIGDLDTEFGPLPFFVLHVVELRRIEGDWQEGHTTTIPLVFGDKETTRATLSQLLDGLQED